MGICVFVATHKKVNLSLPRYCHLIQVGSALNKKIDGYIHDDEDSSGAGTISCKNESYCELTALYYLWKQSDAEVKGLYHYRRLFYDGKPLKTNNCRIRIREKNVEKNVLKESKILSYIEDNDVIVEIPFFPGTTTVRVDLEKFCYKEDIYKLGKVIKDYFPNYYCTFQSVMDDHHASYCNMIIARKEVFDCYCEWLFSVLDKCEEVIDISSYDKEHKRIFGYFGEVLLNVYLRYNNLKEKHVPVMYIFEYMGNGKMPLWIRWIKMSFIQICGRLNISLPTKNTPVMKEFDRNKRKY